MRALRDGGANPEGPWGTWGPQFVNSAVTISHGRIAPVPGGILIKSTDGQNIGVSGKLLVAPMRECHACFPLAALCTIG